MALACTATALAVRAALKRRHPEYDLYEKVVLITGGSRGLGLVLARTFLQEGARLAICARDELELERARKELSATGSQILSVPCDLRDPSQVQRMVDTVREHFGTIDILVNNAGIISVGPLESMTLLDFREAIESNYLSALNTVLAVLPTMRNAQQGRIVNIASIGGKVSVPHLLPYSASKFALVGFSEGLRAELKKEGILVTTVCPGLMRTGSPRNATFKGQHRAEYAWFSISDSLPLLSISAENAARQIVRACQQGTAQIVLSVPAKMAVFLHELFPNLTAEAMALVSRILPAPGGIGTGEARGKDSESALSSSWLTSLSQEAAERNNQVV